MYGMPGNQFCNVLRVGQVGEVADLVKEAQIKGKLSRTFFSSSRKELKVSYDGTFLVNMASGEIIEDDELACSLQRDAFFTKVI